nr:hypothetical protein [Tanacetum cinerariifolium]
MLIQQGEGSGTPTEPHHTPSQEAQPSPPTHISSSSIPNEPAYPLRDVSEGEACPTDSAFMADQDRATMAKSSTLPYDSALRVTSPAAVEGNDARIKGRRIDEEEGITRRVSSDTEEIMMDEGEVAVERTSEDTKETATVLTSMNAATVLAGGIDVPTCNYSIPTAGPPVVDIHTGSDAGPTASPIVATATVRLQEQIDAQVARELEEQQEMKDKRMTEQIDRDAEVARIHTEEELQEVARIHTEEELQGMIDSLDRTNET